MVNTDEADALRALADAHSGAVWRYVVHLTGDHAGADDVVQETLLRAWRTPAILAQAPESTRSWMFTVARHLVIDDVRSARKRHELTVDEVPERVQRDHTDALFETLLVEEALAGLGLEHRSAAVVRVHELGIPEGTVKSRLHYGLRALRLALQEKGVTR